MPDMRKIIDTDYGFVLVGNNPPNSVHRHNPGAKDEVFIEAFGMAGQGRYELFFVAVGTIDEEAELLKEAAEQEDCYTYRHTKIALR